jgi:hypothetical protein
MEAWAFEEDRSAEDKKKKRNKKVFIDKWYHIK